MGDPSDFPARLFLVPAYKAPKCLIVRRKPSKAWHLMLWDTETDSIEHGSWFSGTLYPNRFDLSWDGKWLVYFAMGRGQVWTGICKPPKLTTTCHWNQSTTYYGGGVFVRDNLARLNTQDMVLESKFRRAAGINDLDFKLEVLEPFDGGEDEGVLYPRLRRDGWKNVGQMPDSCQELMSHYDPWTNQPTASHPTLNMWYRGVPSSRSRKDGGFRIFDFALDSHPDLLEKANWATWDCLGQLLVSRKGVIERFTLEDLKQTQPQPSFSFDTNLIQRPGLKRAL